MEKVVVITGGSSGLGLTLAKEFSSKNKVIIISRNKKNIDYVSRKYKFAGFVCDVGSYKSVIKVFDDIYDKYKRVDYLINCAGVYTRGEIGEMEYEKIKEVYEANTLGTIYPTRAVVPIMKDQKSGKIINIISVGGLPGYGKPNRSIYYSSKSAIYTFSKIISEELKVFGIKVYSINPGKLNTEFMQKSGIVPELNNSLDVGAAVKTIKYIVENDDVYISDVILL